MNGHLRNVALITAALIAASEINGAVAPMVMASPKYYGNEGTPTITAIDPISDEIANQNLVVGSDEAAIIFPDTLNVTVREVHIKKNSSNSSDSSSEASSAKENTSDGKTHDAAGESSSVDKSSESSSTGKSGEAGSTDKSDTSAGGNSEDKKNTNETSGESHTESSTSETNKEDAAESSNTASEANTSSEVNSAGEANTEAGSNNTDNNESTTDNNVPAPENTEDTGTKASDNTSETDTKKESGSTEVQEQSGEENSSANEPEKSSEESNSEDESGANNSEARSTLRLNNLFKPLTVYASEKKDTSADSNNADELNSEDKSTEDNTKKEELVTEVTEKQVVLEHISWELDSSKSSKGTFTSEEVGAKFVYVPQIPHVYDVVTDLPSITVIIVEDKEETVLEYMTLEKEGVKVEGNFPEGSELIVSVMSEDDAASLIEGEDKDIVFAYDITVMANGEEVPLDETVKVTITPPSDVDLNEYDTENLELIHVTDEMVNDTVEAEVNNEGNLEFETDGFSPYILTVKKTDANTTSSLADLEPATGKTFSQSVKVTFSDVSLLDQNTDIIKLYLYGNIKSNYTYEAEKGVSGDPFLISEANCTVTASTIEYTFSEIPVYIEKGTGNATEGGSGAYSMPSDFYGIKIDTVSGYTPSGGAGDNYITLAPQKDSNDAVWTTSQITISNSVMELASPDFVIEWQDNRNFAGKRPYSNGYEFAEGGAAAAAEKIDLYYKDGDSYTLVDDSSNVLVTKGSNHPTVTMSSFSNWIVSFEKLPKNKSAETEYQWYIKLSEDFLNTGNNNITYYNISGVNADGYLSVGSTVSLTYSDEISGTLSWRVGKGGQGKIPDIPTSGLFPGMKFYSQTGSSAAVEVTDGSYEVKWESSSEGGGTSWKYTMSGLPLYTASGDAIVYYVKMADDTYSYAKSESETLSYKFTYDNGTYSTDTDKCYSGQKIYATITGDADFSFNKVWYDGNDADSISRRKLAISKGITLYLWRYPENKTQTDGAPVTKDARQYTYTLAEADAGDTEGNSIAIPLSKFIGSDPGIKLAKYDEMGYEYVYYVTEISESELYEIYYYNVAEGSNDSAGFSGESTHNYVLNGGSICNVRSARISPKVTKYWNVSAVSDYVNSVCSFVLQKKEGGEWIDTDATLTLTGFSSSKKKVTGSFDAVNLYNGKGEKYEFRVVERSVTSGSGQTTEIADSEYTYSESDGTYTALYSLNDYSYKTTSEASNIVTDDGVESFAFTVTDKLYGAKKLYITKTWSGDNWSIGGNSSNTGNVTLILKQAQDGGSASDYATIVLNKPENELGETGIFTITYTESGTSESKSFDISNGGKTWKTAAIEVPSYTEDGGQYVYSIEETNVDTSIKYGKEYDKTTTGKEINLFVNNYTGGQTSMSRIEVAKVWNDDSDISQRSDVKVEFGYYDNGNFVAVKNSTSDEYYTLILSKVKDYANHIWIHGEDFLITDEEKTAYNNAADNEDKQKELRGEAIKNHLSIRASLYNDATKEYDRTIVNQTIENGNLTGGVIPAVVNGANSKPGYKVSVNKSASGYNFTITNTRFASRSFIFTKTWNDSDNVLKLRGDFLRVALFREFEGNEEEVAYIDIPTYSDSEKTTLTKKDDLTVTFTNGGEYYPAYDDNGNTYTYSVKEYICTGTPVTTETLCVNKAEVDTPTERKEIDVEATKDTTTTGYVVTTSDNSALTYSSFTTGSSSTNAGSNGTESSEAGITKLLMTENFGYTNQAAGERNQVSFYVIWHDYAKSSQRPDLYYTLYYKTSGADSEESAIQKYEGAYTEKWESVVDGNKFIQKVVYTGLPTADEAGNVYVYYVAETLNNAASKYETKHYQVDLFKGTEYNSAAVEEKSITEGSVTTKQFIVKENATLSDISLSENVSLTKEGSFTLVSIADTVHIEGKKLWTNVPEGILADKLPFALIYLFRESVYDPKNKAPEVEDNATTEEKKETYRKSAVNSEDGTAKNDGSNSPRELNSEKSLYAFGTYNTDGTVASYAEFPKYDELGYQYTYSQKEIIYNELGNELPPEIMQPSYTDNSADLTNVYQTLVKETKESSPATTTEVSNVTNARNFEITKQWNITGKDYQKQYAKATFRLYRMELESDGNGYNNGAYGEEIASFDISSAELVDEIIVTKNLTDTTNKVTTSTITWNDYPIFAPSGKLYVYYALEMTGDMPGYTAALNGADPTKTDTGGSGATEGNTAVSGTDSAAGSYIGVAFSNNGISLKNKAEDNKKTECFLNTYSSSKTFDTITFYKKWNSKDNEGNWILPDINDESDKAKRALNFTVRAAAATQSGSKNNSDSIEFAEGTDYTLSVAKSANGDNIWVYTITFKTPAPVYSLNGNLYTYTVTESFNSEFVNSNYKIVTGKVSALASEVKEVSVSASTTEESTDTADATTTTTTTFNLEIKTHLENSLKNGFTVSKRWDDYSNDYGMREGSVKFKVQYRLGNDGTWSDLIYENASSFELNSGNGWKKNFSGLLTTANASGAKGAYYQYRVIETDIVQNNAASSNSSNSPDTTASTTTITVNAPSGDSQTSTWTQNGTQNTDSALFYTPVSAGNYLVYNPADITDISSSPSVKIVNQLDSKDAVTKLTVTKKWEDNSDEYGLRPSSITVMIQKSQDGNTWTDVVSRTITSANALEGDSNTWEKKFENLPKYYGTSANSEVYQYRAVEIKVGSAGTTLDTATNLPASGGSYSIVQEFPNDSSGYFTTITNTLRTKEEAIYVELRWNDEEETHSSINTTLYSPNFNGGSAPSGVVKESSLSKLTFTGSEKTLTDSDKAYTYSNLPKYNKDGNIIVYYVKEETTGRFKTQYVSSEGDWPAAGFDAGDALCHTSDSETESSTYILVVNTPLTSIEGSKVWVDSENAYKLRPSEFTLSLQRVVVASGDSITDSTQWENVTLDEVKKTNSSPTGVTEGANGATVTISENTGWRALVSSLPLYKLGDGSTHSRYIYRLAEISVPNGYQQDGYTYASSTASKQTSTVTNSLLRRKDITVEKIWNAESSSEKKEVTISLYSKNFLGGEDSTGGVLTAVKDNGHEITRTISSANNWKTVFTNLPSINMDGKPIVYYVAEEARTDSSAIYYKAEDTDNSTYVKLSSTDDAKTGNTADDDAVFLRIVNTPYTSATVSVSWEDKDNTFKTRADSVYVKLQRADIGNNEYADADRNSATWNDVKWEDIPDNSTGSGKIKENLGSNTVITELNATNNWSIKYDNLPLYVDDTNGSAQRYAYRFIETDSTGNGSVPIGYSLTFGATEYVATSDGTESGYSNSYSSGAYATTITNTLITKPITVVKKWEDESNKRNKRPVDLAFNISEDTSKGSDGSFNSAVNNQLSSASSSLTVDRIVSSDGNTWTYTISGLPKYAYGNKTYGSDASSTPTELCYRVTEDVDAEYTISGSKLKLKNYYQTKYEESPDPNPDTTTIVNTGFVNFVNLKVTISWDDTFDNVPDKYKQRPDEVTISIQKSEDGTTWNEHASEIIKANENQAKTIELPKYVNDIVKAGNEYSYRAVVTKVGESVASIDSTKLTGQGGAYSVAHSYGKSTTEEDQYFTNITNKLIVRNSVNVKKVWNDNESTHEAIEVSLYSVNYDGGDAPSDADVKESSLSKLSFTGSQQTLNDSENTCTYSNLPKYNKDGKIIVYYVKEETTGNFKTQYASAEGSSWPGNSAELSDKLCHNTSEGADDSLYVHVINTPLTSIVGSKKWVDDNNAFKLRPEKINFTLQRIIADSEGTVPDDAEWENVLVSELLKTNGNPGVVSEEPGDAAMVTVSEVSGWKAFVSSLPLYQLGDGSNPQKYIYRLAELDEDIPNGYEQDGYEYGSATGASNLADGSLGGVSANAGSSDNAQTSVVSNSLLPREAITVEKIWTTSSSDEKKDATISLYSRNFAGGDDNSSGKLLAVEKNGQKLTRTIYAANGFKTVFEDLPSTNKDGKAIVYYVVEEADEEAATSATYYIKNGTSYDKLSSFEEAKTDGTEKEVTFRIVNTSFTSASVSVKWEDKENDFGTRAGYVYTKLQRADIGTDEYKDDDRNNITWTDVTWEGIPENSIAKRMIADGKKNDVVITLINSSGEWKTTYDKLPAYVEDAGGQAHRYAYRFLETDREGNAIVPIGYSLVLNSVDDNNATSGVYVATNDGTENGYSNIFSSGKYNTEITNTLITKDITVVKIWGDSNDLRKIRPAEINLYITEQTPGNGSFNTYALGGISENEGANPYGSRPVTNTNGRATVNRTVDSDRNTWTYVISGLPKYAYGSDASASNPMEIVYKVTEDTETPADNGIIIRDKYETTYAATGDTTTITNTSYTDDGVLILEKKISDDVETNFAFTFDVNLLKPDGSSEKFAGTYYLYNAAEVSKVQGTSLRADAYLDKSAFSSRDEMTAEKGVVYVAPGKVAVLVDINTGYRYEVTENPTNLGFRVSKVENNGESCLGSYTDGKFTAIGGSDNTTIKDGTSDGMQSAYATGKIADVESAPSRVTITNSLLDVSSHYLGIENVTEVITNHAGEEITGGEVMTYRKNVVVSSEDDVGKNSYAYVSTGTPYVESALSVEFKPDTDAGYGYADELTIGYWENGDGYSDDPPHTIVISNYIDTDSEGNQVPHTGSLFKKSDGTIQAIDASEEFINAWSPLLADDSPYKRITVLQGSVVLTLASEAGELPLVTLVQVSFVAPSPADPSSGIVDIVNNNKGEDNTNTSIEGAGGQNGTGTDKGQNIGGFDVAKNNTNQTDTTKSQTSTDKSEAGGSKTSTGQGETGGSGSKVATGQSGTDGSGSKVATGQSEIGGSQTNAYQSKINGSESQNGDSQGSSSDNQMQTSGDQQTTSQTDTGILALVSEDVQTLMVNTAELKGVRTGDESPVFLLRALFILFGIAFCAVAAIYFKIAHSEKDNDEK